jgi:hypothetical protein
MKLTIARSVVACLVAAIPVIGQADNLTGATRLLCASTLVTRCYEIGDCETGPPGLWNMPSFIEVDLLKKTLSTPAASPEQRHSPFTHVTRENGQIFIQGMENARAFSLVIAEESGAATLAVALDGTTVSAFAACTPVPKP